MYIREIQIEDAENFHHMLCRLDEETEFMMYEPGERKRGEMARLQFKERVAGALAGGDFLLAAVNDMGEIVGFLWAERGKPRRVEHTAYIVTGIRKAYQRQGIGDQFFCRLEEWARERGLVRLELTVECANGAAKELYQKHGFAVEGVRLQSMKVGGRFLDEYYMGKILD